MCCSDAMFVYIPVENPQSIWQLLILEKSVLEQLFGQTSVVKHCARLSHALTVSAPHAQGLRVLEARHISSFRQHPSLPVLCITCRKLHVGSCANWMVCGAGSYQWLACKSSQCPAAFAVYCAMQLVMLSTGSVFHRFFMMAFINTILDRYTASPVAG